MNLTITNLLEQLRQGPVEVDFYKGDGSLRHMRATLNQDLLPPTPIVHSPSAKPHDPQQVRVFDLDKKDWRSFRMERLVKVNGEAI